MISRQALQRTVQRKVAKSYPPAPTSPQIDIPDNWRHLYGELEKPEFLLINETFIDPKTNIRHSIIVFGLRSLFMKLCESLQWYMDGTFNACPEPFSQLFTIHYFFDENRLIPALYCLLTGKPEFVYKKLFMFIRNLAMNLGFSIKCKDFMSDFELAIRNAVLSVWPTWIGHGCYFHFTQALFHKMTELGLKVLFLLILIRIAYKIIL